MQPAVMEQEMSVLHSDTICAISTPHGVGGIAVVRVSGPQAIATVQKIWRGRSLEQAATHTAHLGMVIDASAEEPLDQAVATVYRAPGSFTGQDVVELSVHGSAYVQQQLLHSLVNAGARLAQPGEFTRRAFAAGKMDLAQAEAVADLIASQTRAAHRIATAQMRGEYSARLARLRDSLLNLASLLELELDFSEEDVEFASRQQLLDLAKQTQAEIGRLSASFRAGNAIKNGIPVAIIGATNAGKSSLLNALLGEDRAIVSDVHGTTRDVIEDMLAIGDYQFRIMDTAGLRSATSDAIEAIGMRRSLEAASKADIVLHIIDSTAPTAVDLQGVTAKVITIYNKADVAPEADMPAGGIRISAKTGYGLEQLRQAMAAAAREAESAFESVLVTNERHYQALSQASEALARAIEAIEAGLSGDLIAFDLRLCIDSLSSILGQITSTEILSSIFSRFCIGK